MHESLCCHRDLNVESDENDRFSTQPKPKQPTTTATVTNHDRFVFSALGFLNVFNRNVQLATSRFDAIHSVVEV